METSSILCISISVQTFQFAVKTFYIYFVYIDTYIRLKHLLKYPIYTAFFVCSWGEWGVVCLILKIWYTFSFKP